MQTKSFYLLFVDFFYIKIEVIYVSVLFEHLQYISQYRENTDNRDHFGHYNRDEKFSYRSIPTLGTSETYLTSCKKEHNRSPLRHAFWALNNAANTSEFTRTNLSNSYCVTLLS